MTGRSPRPILQAVLTMVVELVHDSVVRDEPVTGFSETGKQKIILESKMLWKPRDKLKRRQRQQNN